MHFSIFGQDSLNGKVVNEKGTNSEFTVMGFILQ